MIYKINIVESWYVKIYSKAMTNLSKTFIKEKNNFGFDFRKIFNDGYTLISTIWSKFDLDKEPYSNIFNIILKQENKKG